MKCAEHLLSFLYPPYCLHCQEVQKKDHLLCTLCSQQVEFASPSSFYQHAAMESEGPVHSLLREKEGNLSLRILEALAAFLVISKERQSWPEPDCVIPSPHDFPYHHRLAQQVGKLLGIPTLQPFLFPRLRKRSICWKRGCFLLDRTVLVVGIKTREGWEEALLQEAAPRAALFLSLI
ncbi:MAG: hypothetical protein FJZ58_06965 [Chlamydiae bacterium]|nr:hypothetical protein [Chlamydiota bacterium]